MRALEPRIGGKVQHCSLDIERSWSSLKEHFQETVDAVGKSRQATG